MATVTSNTVYSIQNFASIASAGLPNVVQRMVENYVLDVRSVSGHEFKRARVLVKDNGDKVVLFEGESFAVLVYSDNRIRSGARVTCRQGVPTPDFPANSLDMPPDVEHPSGWVYPILT
jgi:hypothetical protein